MMAPAICRDSSAEGSNEKLKITTTSRAKNAVALKASLARHSKRRSLARLSTAIAKSPADGGAPADGSPLVGEASVTSRETIFPAEILKNSSAAPASKAD